MIGNLRVFCFCSQWLCVLFLYIGDNKIWNLFCFPVLIFSLCLYSRSLLSSLLHFEQRCACHFSEHHSSTIFVRNAYGDDNSSRNLMTHWKFSNEDGKLYKSMIPSNSGLISMLISVCRWCRKIYSRTSSPFSMRWSVSCFINVAFQADPFE